MKSKKRALRPPFLITVATLAGAIAPGCGGATTETPAAADGGDCPADMPASGSTCATPGQTCAYDYCGFSREFECVGGKWTTQSVGSCNPPPPVQQCPPNEPQPGTACLGVTAGVCSYPNLCSCVQQGTRDYACTGSKWTRVSDAGPIGDADTCGPCLIDVSNPPADADASALPCPEWPLPATCATLGQVCYYLACGFGHGMAFECKSVGPSDASLPAWTRSPLGECSNPPGPEGGGCPPTEPQLGTNCFDLTPQPCSYPDICCGVNRGTREYTCNTVTLKWSAADAGAATDAGACGPCPDVTDPPESGGD